MERESELPLALVGTCIMVCAGSQQAAAELKLKDAVSAILAKAAATMDEFLGSGMGSWELVRALDQGASNLAFKDVGLRHDG